jgi:hypothetical protein
MTMTPAAGATLHLPIRTIAAVVAAETGVHPTALIGECREARVVRARHLAMWIAHVQTGREWTAIGRVFNRCHSTAIRARRRIERLLPRDAGLRDLRDRVLVKLADHGAAAEVAAAARFRAPPEPTPKPKVAARRPVPVPSPAQSMPRPPVRRSNWEPYELYGAGGALHRAALAAQERRFAAAMAAAGYVPARDQGGRS